MTDILFIAGVLLFAGGMYINLKADARLIALRGEGDSNYQIPRGWLFERISCPNHFGEMIEWLGFALLTWSLPALAFFIWTVANLLPRALAHHKWYKRQFADYPVDRKAVIPGVL
jgi:steroid 5-alpha reductase family enzyme